MSERPYFRFFMGDYLADTGHLDTVEHGAYCLILIDYYKHRRGPGNDQKKLAKIAKLSPKKFAAISETILEFFEIKEGRLWSKRVEKELQYRAKKEQQCREAGKASAERRRNDRSTTVQRTGNEKATMSEFRVQSSEENLKPLSEPAVSDPAGSTGFSRSKKPSAQVPRSDKDALFSFWIRTCKMGPPNPKMSSSRLKLLNARLDDGYTMDDLAMAIEGCSRNPHNRGENDRGVKFMGWDLILRNADKVTYFIECYRRLKR